MASDIAEQAPEQRATTQQAKPVQGQHSDFSYSQSDQRSGGAASLSVYADEAAVQQEWFEDADNVGLMLGQQGALKDLVRGDGLFSSTDLIVLDIQSVGASALASFALLDMRIAEAGAQLLVTTSMEALDQVFGSFDQSNPEILVVPTRVERVIALGRVIAKMSPMALREMSQDDRVMLLRLTEQVEHLAERLNTIGGAPDAASGADDDFGKVESPALAFNGQEMVGNGLVRASRPPMPDPRLIRRIIRQRQSRARFFDSEIFADPAWDMLLDLTAARAEHSRVCVTSLCIASGVPPTTALRWISQMVDAGLFERVEDETDKRRAFIQLSDKAAEGMARYFAELGNGAVALV